MPAERFVGEPGRLDAILARLAGITRADVQRAIASGLVTVDGVVRNKSFALTGRRGVGDGDRGRGAPGAGGTAGAGPVRGRVPARDREAAGSRHAPHRAAPLRHPGEPPARHGRSAVVRGRSTAARHRAPPRRGDVGPHAGGEDRRDPRRAGRDVPAPCRRASVPRARPRTGGARHVRGRRGARPARRAGDPGCDGGRPAETRFEVRERPGSAHPAGGRASRPGARIRSGCTCRRSAIPSWATVCTGGRGTTRAGWGSRDRSCTRGGSRSTTRSPGHPSDARNRFRRTSRSALRAARDL